MYYLVIVNRSGLRASAKCLNCKLYMKIWPPHITGGEYKSPEPRTGVFEESITIKMEFEVTMGLY